jgi:methionyl-tRNA formyltransferase
MRIALAATGRFAANIFHAVADSSHEVVAIVRSGRRVHGMQRTIRPALAHFFGSRSALGIAKRHHLPIVWIDEMNDVELAPLRDVAPDLLLVASFSVILKAPILSLPKLGCLNVHSSLLPRHRGANPFGAAIAAGDEETGVTFHAMEEGIDTGDIIAQYPFPLDERDVMMSAFHRASDLAGDRIVEVLDKIEKDGLVGTPQEEALASYDKKMGPDDMWIRWDDSAESIDRMVRAYAPSTMPRFLHRGHVVRIARSNFDPEPVDEAPGTVLQNHGYAVIATGKGLLFMHVAYAKAPVPWIWPAPWLRPAVGEQLSSRANVGDDASEEGES